MLRVAEYIVAKAGVTVIVNRPTISRRPELESTGTTCLEIAKGDLGPLAMDEASFLNTRMRTAIWRGINAIPRVFGKQRLPGYYEFGVVDHGGRLVPLFVDAKPRTDAGSFYDVMDS